MPRKTSDNPLGLEPVEGQAVTELGIEIPGAAGGLREPLEVDPTLLDVLAPVQHGDTIYVVLQLAKSKVRFQEAADHDGWRRVDIFKVDGAAVIDAETADEAISAQRERVERAKEEAAGIQRITDQPGLSAVPDEGQ